MRDTYEFCEGTLERIWTDGDFLRNICFTDQCLFGLIGGSNRQHDRIWVLQNPHVIHDHRDQWNVAGMSRASCH